MSAASSKALDTVSTSSFFFGFCLGIFLSKVFALFLERFIFGAPGLLRGRTDSKFGTTQIRTSLGRVRIFRQFSTSASLHHTWVVFIHGFAGSMDVFLDPSRSNYCQKLLKEGYHVLAFDLYGSGGSDGPDTKYNVELFVSQLAEIALHFELYEKPFVLLAHSMGSAIAVSFAAQFPLLVSKLILLNPSIGHNSFPWYLRLAFKIPLFREILSAIIIPTFGEGTNVGNQGYLRACYRLLETKLDSKGSWHAGERKTLKFCSELNTEEVLILWGDQDSVVSFSKAKDQLIHIMPRTLMAACRGGDHMSFADGSSVLKDFFTHRILCFLQNDREQLTSLGVITLKEYFTQTEAADQVRQPLLVEIENQEDPF